MDVKKEGIGPANPQPEQAKYVREVRNCKSLGNASIGNKLFDRERTSRPVKSKISLGKTGKLFPSRRSNFRLLAWVIPITEVSPMFSRSRDSRFEARPIPLNVKIMSFPRSLSSIKLGRP
jgi:hypothetical protein